MTARASVVIACRNAAAFLPQTLEAVAAQVWNEPWEIVFADNGSTDHSLAIFRAVAARTPGVPMRSVDASARPGKSFALNSGVAAAEVVKILQCPSDVYSGRVNGSAFGATNYAANTGSAAVDGNIWPADGVFFGRSEVRFRDVIDGSAHTAAFSERLLGNGVAVATGSPLSSDQAAIYVMELSNSVSVGESGCASPSSAGA